MRRQTTWLGQVRGIAREEAEKANPSKVVTTVYAGGLSGGGDDAGTGTDTTAEQLAAHVADTANPHEVTASQAGAEPALPAGGTADDYLTGEKVWASLPDAADARIEAQKGAAGGLAELDGDGKIPSTQVPAIAITDTYVVASQAAMLALSAGVGDVAVRTDESKTYILAVADASVLAHWQEMETPGGGVASVNGQTGTVSLGTSQVPESGGVTYFTNARADARADVRIAAARGAASGIAPLGSDSKVPSANLPTLVNTVAGRSGTVTLSTDDVSEGSARKYYSDSQVNTRMLSVLSADGDILTRLSGALNRIPLAVSDGLALVRRAGAAVWSALTTSDVAEGSNLYYTDARVNSRLTGILTSDQDILIRSGTAPGRLAKGADGKFLGLSGGALAWLTPASGGGSTLTAGTIVLLPEQAKLPATNPATAATSEPTGGRQIWTRLDFNPDVDRYAVWQTAMPNDWDGGTVTARFWWETSLADPDTVTWALQGYSFNTTYGWAQAWGTAQKVNSTNGSASNRVIWSSATPAITLGGSPGAGRLAQFRVARLAGSEAADTLLGAAGLLAVVINYTRTT